MELFSLEKGLGRIYLMRHIEHLKDLNVHTSDGCIDFGYETTDDFYIMELK